MKRFLLCGVMSLAVALGVSAQDKSAIRKLMAAKHSNRIEKKEVGLKPNVQNLPADKKGVWVKNLSAKAASKVRAPFKAPMKADAETETTLWWSYTGSNSLNLMGFGFTDYNLAVVVPAKYAGAKVDSVEVLFADNTKLSNVNIWFDAAEESIPTTVEGTDYHFSVDNSLLKGITSQGYIASTDLELPNEYTIPSGGCVVGYTMTTELNSSDYSNYPIVTFSSSDEDGGFLMYADMEDGKGPLWYSMYGTGYGNLTIALHLDVTGLTIPNASVYNYGEQVMCKGTQSDYYAVVQNDGITPLESISYILSIDGESQPEQTYTFKEPIAAGDYDLLNIGMNFETDGLKEISLEITKVDGEANTSDVSKMEYGTVVVVENSAKRVSVFEEFTGTWCGWCPRGMVALEKLNEEYGDDIITIAGHFSQSSSSVDPMQCYDYASMVGDYFVYNFPSASIDRALYGIDPYCTFGHEDPDNAGKYLFDADILVGYVKDLYPSEGSVSLTANWADEAGTAIDVTTTTTFNYDRPDAPYGLAFIITEDGMTGSGDSWLQVNYYSTEFAELYLQYYGEDFSEYTEPYNVPDMAEWFSAGAEVETEYNHVIVGSYNALTGMDNCFEAPLNKDEEQPFSTTLDVSDNTLIQNKGNLSLAVLLINRNNYQIVNAAQVKLSSPTSIKGVTSSDTVAGSEVVARYNVNGQRIDAPCKGVNILKLANGKSIKVVEK